MDRLRKKIIKDVQLKNFNFESSHKKTIVSLISKNETIITNLNINKRPISAVADNIEVKNILTFFIYLEIMQMVSIIELLDLNTRIWTKS